MPVSSTRNFITSQKTFFCNIKSLNSYTSSVTESFKETQLIHSGQHISWESRTFRCHLKLPSVQKVYMLIILREISNLKLFIFLLPQSSECQRGFRGQHDPTRPLSPSNPSSHFYPQPDPNRVQISQPDNIPIFMFEQPHSFPLPVPLPSLYTWNRI